MEGRQVFSGLGTALITPFVYQGGPVDYQALERLIDDQIEGGVDFLVPCGTTGESPTLTAAEHVEVIRFCVETVQGRVPVLAGTGSNSTAEAVRYTEEAKEAGANGVLVVSPYYNKPMAAGYLDYYRQVAQVGLPVVLYDIPGRTAKGVPTDVIIQLAREGSICGIKWASGNLEQLEAIIANRPDGFTVLSGDDNRTVELMKLGGNGVISVVSHLIPSQLKELINDALAGRWERADSLNAHLLPLMKAMFIETNPQPVKTAAAMMHPRIFGEYFRSPMMPMEDGTRAELEGMLQAYGLLG